MFNLTSSTPKTWQTVSRQADRVNAEQNVYTQPSPSAHSVRDLGGVLRERRDAMGASLAEVETATRIRQKYLAALESDDWHLLPGEVVGRGFLRNYATYLGLDATELVERRRAISDPSMNATLAGTSAASALPPERDVDYRPKDVALKDEPEGIQQREIRTGPFFRIVGVLGALLLAWWFISSFGATVASGITATVYSVQTRVAQREVPLVPTATPAISAENPVVPVATLPQANNTDLPVPTNNQPLVPPAVNPDNGAPTENNTTNGTENNGVPAVDEPTATPTEAARTLILIPTDTPASAAPEVVEPSAPSNDAAAAAANPTATAVSLPTDTPAPPPTEAPAPTPTEAPPTPAPPVVVAPACPDPRSAISSPGVNQVISGAVPITGRAVHEAFQYYKLEYAFGANATDGFAYFDGANSPVDGGTLGVLNTPSLPNGAYTLLLTVVDLSANYPPPCSVTVTIQN